MTFSSSSTQSLYSPRGEKGGQLDRYSRVHFQRAITTLPTIIRQRYLEGKYYILYSQSCVRRTTRSYSRIKLLAVFVRLPVSSFGLLSNSSFTLLGSCDPRKEKLISSGRRRHGCGAKRVIQFRHVKIPHLRKDKKL